MCRITQIVLVSNCPVSNHPMSNYLVSNFPECQIVLVSYCPVSNRPRCQIVLVSNYPRTCKIAQMIICAKLNNECKITHYVWNNTLCIKLHRSPFCVHCDKKSSHSTNLTLALLVEWQMKKYKYCPFFLRWMRKVTDYICCSSSPLDWLPNIRHRRIWKIWKFCHTGEKLKKTMKYLADKNLLLTKII